MRRILTFLALLLSTLLLSSCASTMPGSGDECSFCQLLEAATHGAVTVATPRIEGIAISGRPVAVAVADAQQPGLGSLLKAAVSAKQIRAAGYLLRVQLQKQEGSIEVVCEGKWAVKCEELRLPVPAVFYITPIPLAPRDKPEAGPVYLLRDLN